MIFEHANGLAKLGAKITLVSHLPRPEWYPIEVDYRQVPFQIELAKGIPYCDIIVTTYWEHISTYVEMGIAPVVYFEQGDFNLFDWDNLSKDLKKSVKKQYQLPVEIIAVSSQIVKLIKKQFNRDSYVCPNALNNTIFNRGGYKIP